MLIINAKIVDSNKLSKHDSLYIKNGIIEDVGDSSEFLKYYPKNEILDAKGKTLFPGLVNAHMHGYGILNSYFLNKNLRWRDVFEKLKELQFQKEDMELIYYSAVMAGIFAIRSGVTTVFDICYGSPATSEMIAEAYKILGLRGIVYQSLSEKDTGFISNYKNKNFSNVALGVVLSSNKNYIPIIKKLSKEDRFLVHEDQVSGEEERLMQALLDRDLMSESTVFVHGTYSTRSLSIMKVKNVSLVSCPLVDELLSMNNGFENNDFNLCMGSGMINVNMFTAAKEAFKHSNLSIKEIDNIIQNNNNDLVYRTLKERVGKIRKGYKADLVIAESVPIITNTEYNFVYRENFWIEDVIVNGKLVLKNREILGVKEKEVYQSIGDYISKL